MCGSTGVVIFNWSDTRSYHKQAVWNQNTVYWEGPGLDSYSGHPSPFGEYHTHAIRADLMQTVGDDGSQHLPILGWSYDGFPIYGPWGYANVDGSGGLQRMESSWKVRDITARTHYVDGTNVPDGPSVAAVPLGAYLEDHEYVNALGDLDRYNGRLSVTPEYPEGVYHYHVTIDASSNGVFPYVIGIEYFGVVETANTAGQGGNVGDPAAADIYVSYVWDHNGDGFGDPAFRDPDGYVSGSHVAGKTHVFYGKASNFTADIHLYTLDGTDGFHVDGDGHHDHAGHAVSSTDVNGDSTGDLIIGAHDADPNDHASAGKTTVVFSGTMVEESSAPPGSEDLSGEEDAGEQALSPTENTTGSGEFQSVRPATPRDNAQLNNSVPSNLAAGNVLACYRLTETPDYSYNAGLAPSGKVED